MILNLKFEMDQTVINESPIPLIQLQNQQFTLTEQAKLFLQNISEPLGIVTIVGKYRTGKSLFLNKVLLNNANLFKVSPTINSCTKGLWMSRKTIKSLHPDTPNMDILVIDTQGFGATQQTDNYNNKILLLSLLISSYFIYNSVGSIDQKSLNNLNIITNLAKDLQSKNMNNENLQDQFPSFMWIVRDFTLKMVDLNGCQIEPKQYLEQALQIQKKTTQSAENKNKIRRMIKHFFKERDCCTLVRPVQTQQQLQTLSELDDNYFRPQFLEQINSLRSRMLRRIKPKKLKGKCLTGQTLLQLLQNYINSINSGSLPNIQSTWKHIMTFETSKVVNKIVSASNEQINKFGEQIRTQKQIQQLRDQMLRKSLIKLKESISYEKDITQCYQKIKKQIQYMFGSFMMANKKKSMRELEEAFQQYLYPKANEQSVEQLERQMREMEQKFRNRYSSNACLQSFMVERLFPFKQQNIIQHAKSLQRKIKQGNMKSMAQKQSSSRMVRQLQKELKQVKQQQYNTQREVIILRAKGQQEEKIKHLQMSYVNKQLQQLKISYAHQLQKYSKLQHHHKDTKEQLLNIKYNFDNTNTNLQDLKNSNTYYEKEIQILKNTIGSKSQQIIHLKTQINTLNHNIQTLLQKQEIISIKNKSQYNSKLSQYEHLSSKHQQLTSQYLQVQKYNHKLSAQLQMKEQLRKKENLVQQQLFQSMKQNLKSESEKYQQFLDINKNLSLALKHMEQRFQHTQKKEKQLKQYKKCVKNSSCLQCQNCTKFFVPAIFPQHLNVCLIGSQSLKINDQYQNQMTLFQNIDISIKQTLLKDSDSKPYTQYVLEFQKNDTIWTINRKYKSFCELHSNLKVLVPGVHLSDHSYIVNPQQGTKKSLLVEQRRKVLQKYLIDLSKNPLVVKSNIWKQFISEPEDNQNCSPQKIMSSNILSQISSPAKQNLSNISFTKPPQKTPEQFLKIWNQRNQRQKQISYQKNKKIK